MKAYKIVTVFHDDGDFTVHVAQNAGRAKTNLLFSLMDGRYPNASYRDIKTCHRAPEYDRLAAGHTECVRWRQGRENWQIGEGRWYDHETPPAGAIV